MKEIAPKDSRYIPLTQQRWCCVPACISMIMYRHGISLIPQEELGYYLGLVVPKEDAHLFYNPRTGRRPASGYGTQIQKSDYHPNKVFSKLNIPLKMIFHPIDDFKDEIELADFISKKIVDNADLVTSFSNAEFSDGQIQGGHVCVIYRISPDNRTIRVIDPERCESKWQTYSILKLYKAMQRHGADKMGGIWVFVKT